MEGVPEGKGMPQNDPPVFRIAPVAHRIWLLWARVTAGLGLLFTLALWPSLWLLLTEGFLGALTLTPVLPGARGRTLQTSCSVVVALVATVGLVGVLGWNGVLLATAVGASGLLLGRVRPDPLTASTSKATGTTTPVRRSPVVSPQPQPAVVEALTPDRTDETLNLPGADEIAELDDPSLCQVWRRSYVQLESSRSVSQRMRLVELRQLYLDELDRRHPVQLQSWFASGARAAGNPLPYLRGPTRPPRR